MVKVPDEQLSFISDSAGNMTLVAPAVEFTITASYEGRDIDVHRFETYVERSITIPTGVDASRITTGVVVDADGNVRHVPTKIVFKDGQYHAIINSLTNSVYSVVWHPVQFQDVADHWAKEAINDLGSRLVVNGIDGDSFNPDAEITRAEFMAILVRGLGLKLESDAASFSDVKETDWYASAVNTAVSYHLIDGFEDGTFRPTDNITREQAMVIIAKAMAITNIKVQEAEASGEAELQPYADAANISLWAQTGVAFTVRTGIVSGRSESTLDPQAGITRAEVASIVQRLLQRADLI